MSSRASDATITLIPADEVDDKDEFANLETEEFLKHFLDQDVGEGHIWVKKQLTDGRSQMEHIGNFPLDKFSYPQLLDYLQMTHGGGDYRFMIYITGEDGKQRRAGNRMMPIAAPAGGVVTGSNKEIIHAINAMAENSNKNNLFSTINGSDIGKVFMAAMGLSAPVVIAYLQTRKAKRDPMDMMERMIMMQPGLREMFPTPDEKDEGDEPNLMDIIKQFLPAMLPNQENPGNALENLKMPSSDPKYASFALFFNSLLPVAISKVDAKQTALDFSTAFEGKDITPLLAWLNSEDSLSFILEYHPDFIHCAGWITQFIEELKLSLTKQAEKDIDLTVTD